MRIRREEELPVYERLGDVRSSAVTRTKIADILFARGELDEAVRLLGEEAAPAFERLGAIRESAIAKGRIADILSARGEMGEALRIRREEQLPVFERLGAVRESAITKGRIADILRARGELDEALRIRREEQLPVYERLGDVRSSAVTKGKIADILSCPWRAGRGVAHPPRGAAAGLRGPRRPPRKRGHQGQDRRHPLPTRRAGRGSEPAGGAPRDQPPLGDAGGIGATLWGLAQLDLKQEKVQDAVPRIAEGYAIMRQLGRAEGIATVGKLFGQILVAGGQRDDGLEVLRRSAAAHRQLGREGDAAKVEALIRQIEDGAAG